MLFYEPQDEYEALLTFSIDLSEVDKARVERLKQASRDRYGTPVAEIKAELRRRRRGEPAPPEVEIAKKIELELKVINYTVQFH